MLKPKSLYLVCTLLIFLQLPLVSYSMPPVKWYPEGSPNNPTQLQPWFSEIRQKLRKEPDFFTLTSKLENRQEIFCTFELGKKCDLKNLKVVSSSQGKLQSQIALRLLQKIDSLKKPPNNLPFKEPIAVVFLPYGNKQSNPDIFLWSARWSHHTYGRYP